MPKHDGKRRTTAVQQSGRAEAVDPRWLKLGLAAALGLMAGATLFPRKAQGDAAAR